MRWFELSFFLSFQSESCWACGGDRERIVRLAAERAQTEILPTCYDGRFERHSHHGFMEGKRC